MTNWVAMTAPAPPSSSSSSRSSTCTSMALRKPQEAGGGLAGATAQLIDAARLLVS